MTPLRSSLSCFPRSSWLALGLMLLLSACAATADRSATLPPSRMVETTDLAQVSASAVHWAQQFGTEQVLVVFDLDNTLLAMEQDLGSDQWYDWQKELQAADPCNPEVVTDRLAAQGALYYASAMRLTQTDAPALVGHLQAQDLKVIIESSRGSEFRLQTFRELRRSHLSFHASAIGPPGGYAEPFIPGGGSRPVLYEDGVFLTAGQHKGQMLQALLNKTNTPAPAVIVMADDKLANLQAVMESFAGTATSVQAFRYAAEDPVVAAFDSAGADAQWREAEPALRVLQEQFGVDHFALPEVATAPDCTPTATPGAAAVETASQALTVRLATFNVAMGMSRQGELSQALQQSSHPRLQALAEIIQTVRPDILVLNEFDYDPAVDAAGLLRENYLGLSQNGQAAVDYPYHFRSEVNTGLDSGLDLNGNGVLGEPEDAWGYGVFRGQYGMLLLSRFPIDTERSRTFQQLRWASLPAARAPLNPDGTAHYPEEIWRQLRLSSKSHWDVVIDIGGRPLHVLMFHPTPPVFDGPEDRNGLRNFDELRFWAEYLAAQTSAYLFDDQGRSGSLGLSQPFVIAGDFNADPLDGDSVPGALAQLLDHPRINSPCTARSEGGLEASALQVGRNLQHRGDAAADTSDFDDEFTGNLRLDYLLPSTELAISGCGVFWPKMGQPGAELIGVSDHRLVWLDVEW